MARETATRERYFPVVTDHRTHRGVGRRGDSGRAAYVTRGGVGLALELGVGVDDTVVT
jgi:hypothetical protein